ncbi:hypothetical protein V6V47_00155 [Micromonospora sp. CPCC 205539]|uniref:hypothetical protein n=1 Tax=Micromonospora sp. CPCC 205539 TaxID=3122408 RepID=UPI002FEFA232
MVGVALISAVVATVGPAASANSAAPASSAAKASSVALVQPQASKAPEHSEAVAGSPPSSFDSCVNGPNGRSCFQKYGDKIWVLDTYANGRGHFASWSNWLWDGNSWELYREGFCNNGLTAGVWGYCDKEFYEDSTNPNPYGNKGSGLRISSCDALIGCSDYFWIRNNG